MPPAPPPPHTGYDAVLFDAGGTLIELDFPFIAALAADHGAPVGVSDLRRGEVAARRHVDRGATRAGRVEGRDGSRQQTYFEVLLATAGVPEPRTPDLAQALRERHREAALWRLPIEGAARTLAGLRGRGVVTGVVSNADGRVEGVLHSLGLTEHLGLVLDSHVEGVEKPDPEIFRRALERLSLSAERTLYVGDIYSIDALGARAAGLEPVLLDPLGGYADADCATVASLEELLG